MITLQDKETKKVATKIIENAKNDNRILEQKVTEISNNTSKTKEHYDKVLADLETRMQNIKVAEKKGIANLSTATKTNTALGIGDDKQTLADLETRIQNTETQQKNIKTLSEAISVLLTHTDHILQFLRYLGCVQQPQSPENFVAFFHAQYKVKEINSHTNNFASYYHAYSKITNLLMDNLLFVNTKKQINSC